MLQGNYWTKSKMYIFLYTLIEYINFGFNQFLVIFFVHWLFRSGRTESAKILLKRGAQLTAKDLKVILDQVQISSSKSPYFYIKHMCKIFEKSSAFFYYIKTFISRALQLFIMLPGMLLESSYWIEYATNFQA